jgi:large subunit ribosomal protein L18e
VLGAGTLDHSLVIAAFAFSANAKQQIEKAKGKCMTIQELAKQNPKAKDVRILG